VFDWDGTAVIDRREDAAVLICVAEALLRRRVWLVIVTGTNVENIERQFCNRLAPRVRGHLIVCANRGSEVFGYRPGGDHERRWLRTATAAEDAALTRIAEAARDTIVARTGLDVRIVYDRLNRRKIDLIPTAEWADPPKARIAELQQAVERRLREGGFDGGLRAAIDLVQTLAQHNGLPDARITSDVKHVEVGLTDKGDAMRWIRREIVRRLRLRPDDVLIAGDEFGDIAGFGGSDYLMAVEAHGSPVVSVGVEPNGVPEGVRRIGGGPARFRRLLAEQVWLRRREIPSAAPAISTATADWAITVTGIDAAVERETESVLALGNGFLGVRASVEHAVPGATPLTLAAGVFAPLPAPPHLVALAAAPNWDRLTLCDTEALPDVEPMASGYARTLDMRRGLLLSREQRTLDGVTTRIETARFVSLADRRLAVQRAIVAVDSPEVVQLSAAIEPAAQGLVPSAAGGPIDAVQRWAVDGADRTLALATSAGLMVDGRPLAPAASGSTEQHWRWVGGPGQSAELTRTVAIAREECGDDRRGEVAGLLQRAARTGFDRLLTAHARAWEARWRASEVVVEGDADAQRALRFAVYHLTAAANPADERVGIGARGLTGGAYLGHVFWDSEIFMQPFYALTWPQAARAQLCFRYRTLPAARARAAALGYRGALYAWESAESGAEETPQSAALPDGTIVPILCGRLEQHISADVAYAVWTYWRATGDAAFLRDAGAEILFETARFWASRATLEADGWRHIRGVIGPDEYHEFVDDNAFTNAMARWNLLCGVTAARLLRERWPRVWRNLCDRLRLDPSESAGWSEVAARIFPGRRRADGVVEQFAGFFDREEIDLSAYTQRSAPLDLVLGRERTRCAQVLKQADVTMALALLWDSFAPADHATNFAYYAARCGHGSSLSPGIHALVAARLGQLDAAIAYFRTAAAIDLDEKAGGAALGVHLAALGTLWQTAVFGFAGLRVIDDGIALEPQLPQTWRALRFPVTWHGRRLAVAIDRDAGACRVVLEAGAPCTVALGGETCRLRHGEFAVADLAREATQ
jgi:trehalose/maltose hydrolase-like predicted phosphorylase